MTTTTTKTKAANPAITSELARIAEENNGVLLPKAVVEAARSQNSPLHSWFEWDDSVAAEAYRLEQARYLIRITVEYPIPGEVVSTRMFVSLTPDRKESGYRRTITVLSDTAFRKQMLADALADMQRFEQKYIHLKELVDVFAAMRRVRSKTKTKARKTSV